MLTTCLGLSLRTGTSVISIVNSIAWILYILFYVREYSVNFGYPKAELNDIQWDLSTAMNEMFTNYMALMFMLVGFTSLYASLSLKQATLKNEIQKIYLWLLIEYVQLGTFIATEIVIILRHITTKGLIGLILCSIIINVIIVYQLLVVHSFYAEEKLVQETNYTRLSSELASQVEQDDEFQNVDL